MLRASACYVCVCACVPAWTAGGEAAPGRTLTPVSPGAVWSWPEDPTPAAFPRISPLLPRSWLQGCVRGRVGRSPVQAQEGREGRPSARLGPVPTCVTGRRSVGGGSMTSRGRGDF